MLGICLPAPRASAGEFLYFDLNSTYSIPVRVFRVMLYISYWNLEMGGNVATAEKTIRQIWCKPESLFACDVLRQWSISYYGRDNAVSLFPAVEKRRDRGQDKL